jgi:hypothetical protein
MLSKILNCKVIVALIALVLSFLMILQEKTLGSSNVWLMGLIIAVATGLVLEVINMVNARTKFNWLNVLSAVAGGVIAIIIALLKWGSC